MNCSCEVHERVKHFQLVLYIPAFIIGLILNVLALQTVCWKFKKWTETTIYMTNLAVSDVMVLFTLPFHIYAYQHIYVNKTLCTVVVILHGINFCMSIFIITFIIIDRYIAIKYPFKATVLRSPTKAVVVSAVIWIFTIVWTISFTLTFHFPPNEANGTDLVMACIAKPLTINSSVVPNLTLHLVIPLIIVAVCSFGIIKALQQRNMSNPGGFNTKKTMRIIVANAVVFIVCFLPFNIIIFVQIIMNYMQMDCATLSQVCPFYQVTNCIANINCCLDGFCFYFVTIEASEYYQNQDHQQKDSGQNITFLSLWRSD
ncbi:G-protein coupled receptor 35-like [Stegostoma tigrinum]|uniref:G-protein coupled receptor 35-like n=1 Tax=Stegostoma tigrinum TaxID=3053191 RepID=UPI00202AF572|nr:G-protein coupled receptor 35-like [Stegostoma tigrinum]XP_048398686.1 G-protein coupled receptor 35-like [Stegostoma tigrinum]XP_048398687.1 G-protein coupled receptor 35-like [Stegostoma tigrinum]XP_048398688.1 G-protein coupled receptor 35-like [Stegostoma tigrinum]XP_059506847.1 G-protein coupled receptor 35-like [Stegostoma tigrinum]